MRPSGLHKAETSVSCLALSKTQLLQYNGGDNAANGLTVTLFVVEPGLVLRHASYHIGDLNGLLLHLCLDFLLDPAVVHVSIWVQLPPEQCLLTASHLYGAATSDCNQREG